MDKSVTLGRMSENVRKCKRGTALHQGATCRQAESCARLAGRKGKSAAGGEDGGGLSRCLSSCQPINSWRDEPGDFETGAPQLVGLSPDPDHTEHRAGAGWGLLLPVEICPTSSSSEQCTHQASQRPAELNFFSSQCITWKGRSSGALNAK